MTPQYRHWIAPANVGQWPSSLLCVDCVSTVEQDGASVVRQRERLVSWHGVLLWTEAGKTVGQEVMSGSTPDGLLRLVGELSAKQCNLWVVSHKCQKVWPLLKLWEAIEHGDVKILDTDYRSSQAVRDRLREYRMRQRQPLRPLGGTEISRLTTQASGYLVIEDPPNILRGRFHGAGNSTTWIDVRNYGIDPDASIHAGRDTSEWIAQLMSRMLFVCDESKLTALKSTSGSQSMAAWRYGFLTESVHVHTDRRATSLESDAYCGGRCEASRIGLICPPVWHLDFRSQYGWVCGNTALPTGLHDYCEYHGGRPPVSGADYSRSIADVEVITDEPAYPVKRDGLVIYPVGRFRTTLCGPELLDALERGRVIAFHAEATYSMGRPLKAYANALHALRCREERIGVPGVATWIKRLIVGLPGKLGQRNHRWIDCPDLMPQSMYGEWYGEGEEDDVVRYRAIGGIVQRDCVEGYAADSVPAIAGYVTSYGRMRLLGAIRIAGRENVYYYDTDSLFVNEKGYEALARSEYMTMQEMGALTLRGRPERLEIRGIKYYIHDNHVVCSGLARGNIVDSGDGMHYERHLSAVEQARSGKRPESVVVKGMYHRADDYRLGTVCSDGSVKPIVLNEAGATK